MKIVLLNSLVPCYFCEEEILDLESHKVECIRYVKYQNNELEFKNSILKLQNYCLKTEISALKAKRGKEKEIGFFLMKSNIKIT